ncbi:nitrilase-related carbon-nitrogen hydrolase, partial [Kibdelosporangium lantanae]
MSTVVLLAVAFGYGGWRMTTPSGDSSRVAAVTVEQSFLPVDISSEEGKDLVGRFATALQSPSLDGARVVVLPEKALATDAASVHLVTDPLARIATQRGFDVIVGVLLTEGEDEGVNQAIDLPANGMPVRYDKHHLIPGLESDLTPGEGTVTIPGSGGRWGVAICFDMDFPQLLRDNRDIGVTAMFVPGWDFDTDAWLHSRKAVLGGVEYGLSLVRSARNGALTVSDPMGR